MRKGKHAPLFKTIAEQTDEPMTLTVKRMGNLRGEVRPCIIGQVCVVCTRPRLLRNQARVRMRIEGAPLYSQETWKEAH